MGSASKVSAPKMWKGILVAVLITFFLLQVWESLLKFVKRQTTIVTTTENADSVPLPSMSLCPGFRVPDRDYYEQYEDLHEFLESDPDITEEDLLSWWHNETYEIQDIVTGVRPDYARMRNLTPITGAGPYDHIRMNISEMSTNYGKCYTFRFGRPLGEGDFYAIHFDLTRHDSILVYLHEEGNEVGLNWSFWPISPSSLAVRRGQQHTVLCRRGTMAKRVHDVVPCEDKEGHSYPGCITQWARKRYRSLFTNGTVGCWYPAGRYLAEGSDFPPCSTKAEEDYARDRSYLRIMQFLPRQEEHLCPRRCRENTMEVEPLHEPASPRIAPHEARLYLYASTKLEHREEILMHDFNSIVSAIGGSLGLFLGFSCLSMCSFLGRAATRFWEGLEDERRRKTLNKTTDGKADDA